MNSRTHLNDYFHTDEDFQAYLNTLPFSLKDSIIQSFPDIKTVGELKSISNGLIISDKGKRL